MKAKIIHLSNQLRAKGLNVSIRSTQTALDTYEILETNDIELLKSALRSVYVKDRYDLAKFDEVFNDCFRPKHQTEDVGLKNNSGTRKRFSTKGNKYNFSRKGKVKKQPSKFGENQFNHLSGTPLLDERKQLERDGEILNKDLTKMNRFDARVMELCQQLGRRIANKKSRRNRLAKTNKVDIRKTMRRNIKYGGVPIDLVKSKPRKRKNQHLFLNDISGSCEWISSWFFMLMYSCQSAFKQSRVFEFDNKVIETTEALKNEYMINAFADVRSLRMRNAMIHGTSDMYSSFKQFMDKANINNKSYIIILSDCRDWSGPKINNIPKSVEIVRDMARESKKVVILNPEDKYKWNVVDSCVGLYQEAGAEVYEVNTLNQLADFVSKM